MSYLFRRRYILPTVSCLSTYPSHHSERDTFGHYCTKYIGMLLIPELRSHQAHNSDELRALNHFNRSSRTRDIRRFALVCPSMYLVLVLCAITSPSQSHSKCSVCLGQVHSSWSSVVYCCNIPYVVELLLHGCINSFRCYAAFLVRHICCWCFIPSPTFVA